MGEAVQEVVGEAERGQAAQGGQALGGEGGQAVVGQGEHLQVLKRYIETLFKLWLKKNKEKSTRETIF